jgi:hypothetical protein
MEYVKKTSIVLLCAISWLSSCRAPLSEVYIARAANLTKDWTEFRPSPQIRWSQPDGEISFHIDTPHKRSNDFEIIGPNGELCVPEVELISDNGQTLVIDTHGWTNQDMVFFIWNQPSHIKNIQAVRIRSSLPLQISNLRWEGYDFAKIKK